MGTLAKNRSWLPVDSEVRVSRGVWCVTMASGDFCALTAYEPFCLLLESEVKNRGLFP